MRLSEKERLLKNVNKTDTCWLWTAMINNGGYGVFRGSLKTRCAHRHSYNIFIGKIPEGKMVLHKCDVRHCVNPKHLFLGDQFDNMQDMVKKGRQVLKNQNGEKNSMSKLTHKLVSDIKILRKNTNLSCKKIGDKFNVSAATICLIINNKIWKEYPVGVK